MTLCPLCTARCLTLASWLSPSCPDRVAYVTYRCARGHYFETVRIVLEDRVAESPVLLDAETAVRASPN